MVWSPSHDLFNGSFQWLFHRGFQYPCPPQRGVGNPVGKAVGKPVGKVSERGTMPGRKRLVVRRTLKCKSDRKVRLSGPPPPANRGVEST